MFWRNSEGNGTALNFWGKTSVDLNQKISQVSTIASTPLRKLPIGLWLCKCWKRWQNIRRGCRSHRHSVFPKFCWGPVTRLSYLNKDIFFLGGTFHKESKSEGGMMITHTKTSRLIDWSWWHFPVHFPGPKRPYRLQFNIGFRKVMLAAGKSRGHMCFVPFSRGVTFLKQMELAWQIHRS